MVHILRFSQHNIVDDREFVNRDCYFLPIQSDQSRGAQAGPVDVLFHTKIPTLEQF